MSDEHHHHHHGHPSDNVVPGKYDWTPPEGGGEGYGAGYAAQPRTEGDAGYRQQGDIYRPAGNEDRRSGRDSQEELRKERRGEVEGGLGAMAAGAFALHEDREAKLHPEHERRHKVEEEMAAALAAGGVGYGVYEHEKRKDTKEAEEPMASSFEEPKKHHGLFHRE